MSSHPLVSVDLVSAAKGWGDSTFALRYIDTIRDYVALEIAAGRAPEQSMLLAQQMLEVWSIVHVDGCVRGVAAASETKRDAGFVPEKETDE